VKILFANNLCGYYGGVEQVVAHTARALARRGHVCHLAYARTGTDLERFSKLFEGVSPCSEFGTAPGSATGEPFNAIVEHVKPDVVFYHKVDRLPPGVESETPYKTAILAHDHDLWCPTGLGYDRRTRQLCDHVAGWRCYLSLAFLEKREGGAVPFRLVSVGAKVREMRRYTRFDVILANSSFIREKLITNGFPAAKTHLCHPVLDQPDPEPVPLPNEPQILYVGSLIRGKGVDLLLRALAELPCPFHLKIVGKGKSEEELRELAGTLGLSNAVTFVGWVPNDEIARYYQEAKVVAVPSAWPEPFGLVGLEAMRHGRPVAAFRAGGIPDWLDDGETGMLAPPLDVTAYAADLERLLSEPGLAEQLGVNGLRRVREKFSFEGYIDTLERHLLDGGGPANV